MRGVEFVYDLRCNYLTIPYGGREDDFALRMLTANRTDGFLPLELRRMDGQVYLYYNISGMQNMEVIYAEKTIDREMFQMFMWNLHEAIEQSRELFLPGEGICLEPSMLFWSLGSRRWEFVYLPKQEDRMVAEIQNEKEQLAEFLVMRIDYADKKLTDTAYRFYEEICAGRMETDIFLEREEPEAGNQWEDEQIQEIRGDRGAQQIREDEEVSLRCREEETEEVPESKKESDKKGLWRILATLWCAAAAATLLLGKTMQNVILPGGTVIGLLTVLLIALQIKQKRMRKDLYSRKTDEPYPEEQAEYIPYDEEGPEEEEPAEEKTVYMDIRREQEKKLYGIGKFRQNKIFLDRLPCIVGKDKTLADHIISDTSISRMHARFFAEEDTLWMQDLNSTNGTYHNGLRLRPNEKVMLEPEDEVGFGRAQFVFR